MRSLATALMLGTAILALFCVDARGDGSDGELEFLDGGSLRSSFGMSLGFLYGAGSRPDGLGVNMSTVRSGVASVSGNPAGLAYLETDSVLLDVLPPFGASASDFLDLEEFAADAIDEAVADISAPGLEPTYPELSASVDQHGGVISGAVGARFGRFVAAASIEEPLYVGLELVDTGLEAFGETAKEEGDDLIDIRLRCMLDAAADLTFEVDKTTVAAATEVYPKIALGLSFSRYHASARTSGHIRGEGIINYGGAEYAFNDPRDPWENQLWLSSEGAYEGTAYGWGIGASWRPIDLITVDLSHLGVPELTLEGSLVTEGYVLPGLLDDEFDLDHVSDAQPTLTERTEEIEEHPAVLRLPSQTGLAVSVHTSWVLATAEYRHYSGALGFVYQDAAEGIEVSDGFGLELDFGGLRLGGGVVRGTLMGDAVTDGSSGDGILIPMANIGLGINIGENMRVDTMVVAVPLQILRVSLGYDY